MEQLKKSDFFNLPEVERINALNQSADKFNDNYTYSKPLSEAEIKTKSAGIIQALQVIQDLTEDKKELSVLVKEQNKIIAVNHKEVISKFVQVKERVWEVINVDSGFVETINKEGFIIEETRIKSGTQMNIFNNKKAM